MTTAKEVLALAKEKKAAMVDLKFMDFVGIWQHFTIPIAELTEDVFGEGLGFDGSSIRGWAPINASDMMVVPDPATAQIDPFMKDVTLSLLCNIFDPITREAYSRDPRYIAQKAEGYLKKSGIGDVACPCSATTARGCTRTSRCGRAASRSSPATVMRE